MVFLRTFERWRHSGDQRVAGIDQLLVIFTPACANNGHVSPYVSELFNIYDFTGSVSNLTGGTGGVSAFNDLGSGSLFSSATVSNSDNGHAITFTFNALGIAAVGAANGTSIVFGSALDTSTPTTNPNPCPAPVCPNRPRSFYWSPEWRL